MLRDISDLTPQNLFSPVRKMSPYFLASRLLKFDSLLKILQEKRNLEFFEKGHFRNQSVFLNFYSISIISNSIYDSS